MKQGWTYKKLGEVCNIDYGTRVVRSRDAGSIYPVYGGGGATFKMDAYNREDCMVISRFGMSEQCTRFVKGKFFLNDSGLTLSMKEPCMIQAFMDWEVFSLNNIIYSLGRGAAQKNLDTKALADVILSYPNSLSEQQRIVSRLDSAFAHIDELKANAEKQVNVARALFQKALSKAMEPKEGWKEKKLEELCEIKSILVDPTEEQYRNLIHVGGANIVSGTGELIELKTAAEEELTSGKFTFDDNDVLYNKIRPYLIKVSRPDFSGLCSADMYPLTSKKGMTRDYLYYILVSRDFTDYAIMNSARAGMPKLNRQALFAYKCMVPSLSEQQRIVGRLDSLAKNVKALEENQRKVMAECDALKQALLRKVFE